MPKSPIKKIRARLAALDTQPNNSRTSVLASSHSSSRTASQAFSRVQPRTYSRAPSRTPSYTPSLGSHSRSSSRSGSVAHEDSKRVMNATRAKSFFRDLQAVTTEAARKLNLQGMFDQLKQVLRKYSGYLMPTLDILEKMENQVSLNIRTAVGEAYRRIVSPARNL